MIRFGPVLVVLCAFVRCATADVAAQDAAPEPYQLVRTLQLLQDQIAYGSIEAHGSQQTVLAHVAEQFLKADPALWREQRNARAAVVFLLSGGHPQVVRTLLDRQSLNREDKLLIGALAYVEGREREAFELFRGFDARALPPTIGGHVALVQSALFVRQDLQAALQYLDDARLLMPGTLVEEAALRREIFVAGQYDDFDKFEFLSTQYIRRYRQSVYSGNFRQRFALALTRFSFAQDAAHFARLGAILDHLDVPSRRSLYLLIARTAVVRAKPEMAQLAAEQAAALGIDGSPEKERARLYRAAARLITDNYDAGAAELGEIAKSQLPQRDLELLDAASTLARNLRKPFAAAVPAANTGAAPSVPPAPARLDVHSADEALARAGKVLTEADRLLKEKVK